MLSLENVEKINTYSNNHNNMTSVNAKQTAVNQAAQIAMNRGQFQPFYYYTANNGQNGPQSVQLHSYPNMMGMNPQLFAHPQFAYNFYQAQAQAQNAFYQQQNNTNHHNNAGANSHNHHHQAKQANPIKHHKGKVSNKNSDSNSSDHGLDLHHSKTSSGSEGTNSCDMDGKSTMHLNNSGLASEIGETKTTSPATTKTTKNKKKNKKPSKKVIVVDLPEDLQSIESVTNRCQQYGEILLVRVIRPGKILPYDLKMYTNKIHDLGTTTCAIIEFENSNGASKTVEMEENNLKLTLLQHGAELQLYGNSDGKASSELGSHLESEHTHGESGIGERSSGTRSESTHSHDDSYTHNSVHEDSVHDENNNNKTFTNKIQINKEIKLEKNTNTSNNNNAKNNIFRPSFLKNKSKNTNSESESQSHKSSRSDSLPSSNLSTHSSNPPKLGLLGISPGKEFELNQDEILDNSTDISDSLDEYIIEETKKITINNKSKIINTNNGRVTTALNIKLTVNKPSVFNRNAIKMDLAHPEPKQLNMHSSEIFSRALPSSIGRSSPALLSDPSDDLLLKSRISSDSDASDFEYRSYNRTFLYSLRECRRAQELPMGLPNIPKLLPVARRM